MKLNCVYITALIGLVIFVLAGFGACGDDGSPSDPGDDPNHIDTTPPSAVTDLAIDLRFPEAISITWTAPGDDGNDGTAEQYDIRYSDQLITEQTWETDVQLSHEPRPIGAGLQQSMRVYGLEPSSDYHFAMKTYDEASNVSGLSNSIVGRTLPEDNRPATTSDLNPITLDETSFMLIWTTPGDDGMLGLASQYDVRYAQSAFGTFEWETATKLADLPTPKTAGELDTVIVSGLQADTHYRFALKTADEVPNWSGMSNVARGLSWGEVLATSGKMFTAGDTLVIVYRAPGEAKCTLRIKQSSVETCEPAPWGYNEILVSDRLPAGTYTYFYDFYNENTQTYEPPYGLVFLCWGSEFKSFQVFNLR
jgi:hypothetical protein